MAYKGAMRTLTINGNTYQVSGDGLTADVKEALLNCFEHVAWTDEHGQDYVDALEAALYPPANLLSISAVYTQSGAVYNTDSLDDLKSDLVVEANYDNGTSAVVTNYTLSGTLVEGTSVITVTYGGKTTTFSVTVTEWLTSISAVYTQSGVIYDDDTLNDLKNDLVVTAHYADSTTETVTDYTLSGTLTAGTSTITVSYSGKTTTFNVTVMSTAIDYTIDPLVGITWNDGYTYDKTTGALTATTGEHCTDKFYAQECVYVLTNSNASANRYFALFAWDDNDNYLGYVEYSATLFAMKRGYKYAIKVYNTGTYDPSAITLLPKDNTLTAASTFSIRPKDFLESISIGSNARITLDVSAIMSAAGVTSSNMNDKINSCNYTAVLSPIGSSDAFVQREFTFWFNTIDTFVFKLRGIINTDVAKEWVSEHDPIIVFNE